MEDAMKRQSGWVLLVAGLLGTHAPAAHAQLFQSRRRSAAPIPVQAQPERVTPAAAPTPAPQPMQAPAEPPAEFVATPTPTVTIDPGAATRSPGSGGPAVQVINSKSLLLDFELKGVGPSGLGGVELWYTRTGQIWHKYEGALPTQSPIPVDVAHDGLYGFTIVVSNGVGLGRTPPQPGEPPQMWVEVDTTRPEVKLVSTQAAVDESGRTLIVRWTAADKNLVARPITLSYAEGAQGPWLPFATNVENTGVYVWHMSPGLPNSVLVKVEATDRVGNVGEDQSTQPAPIDLSRPQAALIKATRNGTLLPVPTQPASQTRTTGGF
jgi:hypothetical protein